MVGCALATSGDESLVPCRNAFGHVDVVVRRIDKAPERVVLGPYTDGGVQNVLVDVSVERRVRRFS